MNTLKRVLVLPLALAYVASDQRALIDTDIHAFAEEWSGPPFRRLLGLLAFKRQFRTIYYCRLSRGNARGRLLGALLRPVYREESTLRLGAGRIGPGMFFVHGFSTIVWAEEIGARFCVYQNVTVGSSPPSRARPTIGDDVTIYSGAVVIGAIHIGDGVVIGANAVVTKDVPAHHVAMGVPARSIPLSPERREYALRHATGSIRT